MHAATTTATRELHNPVTGQRLTILEESPERLEMEASFPAGAARPPIHYHPIQHEHFEVLEGRLRVHLDGEERVLEAGDTIDIPPGAHHEMTAEGDSDARARWEVRPALNTVRMFETLFGLAADGHAKANGVPGLLRLVPIMRAHAGEIRVASPPWPVQRALIALLMPLARLRGFAARR